MLRRSDRGWLALIRSRITCAAAAASGSKCVSRIHSLDVAAAHTSARCGVSRSTAMTTFVARFRRSLLTIGVCLSSWPAVRRRRSPNPNSETEERSRIAAANLEDAIVVDCQLPGKLQKLGGMRTYLTPGRLMRLSAVDCRARGGEYTIGDLSSGTLSIQRWLPLAESGEAEAQYYVARIYANGMGGVAMRLFARCRLVSTRRRSELLRRDPGARLPVRARLGVPKDSMRALNLQRKAAGLGDELDYAWKITAAEEEGARQLAAVSEQLDAAEC